MSGVSGVLRLGFSGDVSFTGAFARPLDPERRFAPEVAAFLAGSHYNVLNVEGPVTERPGVEGIGPTVLSPPAAALPALRHLRADVWNLANNHALDAGPGGLDDTLAAAEGLGARTLGGGRSLEAAAAPLVLEGEGVRVGLLAVCDGSGVPAGASSPGVLTDAREGLVRERLAELRRGCGHVVLSYHGGEEYTWVPMPRRRRRLLRYLEQGADVVIAHHAHTVQGWERVAGGLVFYGLGNFVFDHPALLRRPGTYEGLLLRLSFSAAGVAWEPFFTRADRAAGTVSAAAAPAPSFAPVQAAGLRARWCRDAHRVVTLPRVPAADASSPPEAAAPQAPEGTGRTRLPLARLRSALQVARTPNYRRVVLAALEHRVRRALGAGAAPSGG